MILYTSLLVWNLLIVQKCRERLLLIVSWSFLLRIIFLRRGFKNGPLIQFRALALFVSCVSKSRLDEQSRRRWSLVFPSLLRHTYLSPITCLSTARLPAAHCWLSLSSQFIHWDLECLRCLFLEWFSSYWFIKYNKIIINDNKLLINMHVIRFQSWCLQRQKGQNSMHFNMDILLIIILEPGITCCPWVESLLPSTVVTVRCWGPYCCTGSIGSLERNIRWSIQYFQGI